MSEGLLAYSIYACQTQSNDYYEALRTLKHISYLAHHLFQKAQQNTLYYSSRSKHNAGIQSAYHRDISSAWSASG